MTPQQQTLLKNFGITELNEMQVTMQQAFEADSDIILISPTGSGKTLAFLLPIVTSLEKELKESIQTVIVVPTRELALQIEMVFKQMSSGFKISCVYGGHNTRIEESSLSVPPTVLVGTPGRISYHIRNENIAIDKAKYLVLDEFDKSLESGFKDEMEYIVNNCKSLKKRLFTSATPLEKIPSFIGKRRIFELNFTQGLQQPIQNLSLKYVNVKGDDKLEALLLLMGALSDKSMIVFCNHRDAVNRISTQLTKMNFLHGFYHGGLEQIDREKTLILFRNGSVRVLISTDLGSRGLDIPEIDVIIHYQLPLKEDAMIHRNGRTARMNASGEAYFLLDVEDKLPHFLKDKPKEVFLPIKQENLRMPAFRTLYISAGKKDKISKVDIAGWLHQKGMLQKDELGRIDILDKVAYAAIAAPMFKTALARIKEEKLKGKKVKVEEAYLVNKI